MRRPGRMARDSGKRSGCRGGGLPGRPPTFLAESHSPSYFARPRPSRAQHGRGTQGVVGGLVGFAREDGHRPRRQTRVEPDRPLPLGRDGRPGTPSAAVLTWGDGATWIRRPRPCLKRSSGIAEDLRCRIAPGKAVIAAARVRRHSSGRILGRIRGRVSGPLSRQSRHKYGRPDVLWLCNVDAWHPRP